MTHFPVPSPLSNPLLDFSTGFDWPRFDLITAQHLEPAVKQLLAEARDLVQRLITESAKNTKTTTWQNFGAPLADGLEPLSRVWGVAGHLHAVNDTPEWRAAYNALLPDVSRFFAELGQNLQLFANYKAILERADFSTLSAAQQKIVHNEVRDFRLSGAELPEDKKPRFQAIAEELAALSSKFSENVLDTTNAFSLTIEQESELAGLPKDVLQAAQEAYKAAADVAQRAEQQNLPENLPKTSATPQKAWTFTLHAPSYIPVLQYAENRELRAKMYRASATRASEFGAPALDNSALIQQILKLKRESAAMLGFANFAEVSLVPKMAESVPQVLHFLRDLASRAKPFAEQDKIELQNFAQNELGLAELQAWDVAYATEKLREARYAFAEQEVKAYFTEPKVIAGLFQVIEKLFKVRITLETAPVWHTDVRFYRLETLAGASIGHVYVDLYARASKRSGAWMDEAITRRQHPQAPNGIQTPIAYLNCNFSRPLSGAAQKPATFTHDDVITLFHESGHVLHHLLTRAEEMGVSGIHGVEWDAVELPSQFMENYCWDWQVLQGMSAHVDTGATLPRELFDKMLAAKNFQSGMQTMRQIEFALFDMLLHADFDPETASVQQLLDDVRREVAVFTPPAWQRFQNSFSHIFAGGYAAGYFSYKWAEVLSADCFAAFEESGDLFDRATGERFLNEILSAGGVRPALENFRAFRGREPRVDALLTHSGMIAKFVTPKL